jgi:hypothetical protein
VSVQFKLAANEGLAGLAVELTPMLEKLDDGEALATLVAYSILDGRVQPDDEAGRLRVWPSGSAVEVAVTQHGRTRRATYDFSAFVDWDEHETNHSGYVEAVMGLLETVNEELADGALP